MFSLDDSTECQTASKKEEQNDKEKKDEEETPLPTYRAKSIVESWVWGKQPGITALLVIVTDITYSALITTSVASGSICIKCTC